MIKHVCLCVYKCVYGINLFTQQRRCHSSSRETELTGMHSTRNPNNFTTWFNLECKKKITPHQKKIYFWYLILFPWNPIAKNMGGGGLECESAKLRVGGNESTLCYIECSRRGHWNRNSWVWVWVWEWEWVRDNQSNHQSMREN